MSLTYTRVPGAEGSWGRLRWVLFDVLWDSSYPTGGEILSPAVIGIANLTGVIPIGAADATSGGIVPAFIPGATPKLMALRPTASGTFTGTAPVSSLNLATPAFSGTGLTAAGQVMTTTDNQTMTLNQCAGMWLIPATGATPPMLILSNTAVAAAPAVLTVQGSAATDAGAYKIVKSLTPVGTFTGTNGSLAEVSNAVSLATVTSRVLFIGN